MKFIKVRIESILWGLVRKIVMNQIGPQVSIDEWIEEAIREKILREPTY